MGFTEEQETLLARYSGHIKALRELQRLADWAVSTPLIERAQARAFYAEYKQSLTDLEELVDANFGPQLAALMVNTGTQGLEVLLDRLPPGSAPWIRAQDLYLRLTRG